MLLFLKVKKKYSDKNIQKMLRDFKIMTVV